MNAQLGDLTGRLAMRLRGTMLDDPNAVVAIVLDAHGFDRAVQIAMPATPVDAATLRAIEAAIAKVERGMPVHRALGARDFHGLTLALSPETLEPRDDTETLVEAALARLAPADHPWRIADLGTGTGAVGLALLAERPRARLVATDISAGALATAQRNAAANGFTARVETVAGSWCAPLDGRFDAIVSNPPYIASAVVDGLDPSVRDHDPRAALDGGTDGLDAYRAILADAGKHLTENGFLALEIGYDQHEAVTLLADGLGWSVLSRHTDLAGRDRALVLRPTPKG